MLKRRSGLVDSVRRCLPGDSAAARDQWCLDGADHLYSTRGEVSVLLRKQAPTNGRRCLRRIGHGRRGRAEPERFPRPRIDGRAFHLRRRSRAYRRRPRDRAALGMLQRLNVRLTDAPLWPARPVPWPDRCSACRRAAATLAALGRPLAALFSSPCPAGSNAQCEARIFPDLTRMILGAPPPMQRIGDLVPAVWWLLHARRLERKK